MYFCAAILFYMDRISRRGFLKITGIAGAATVLASGCGRRNDKVTTEVPEGQMTYRNLNGDRISLLGYGCMRWPQKAAAEGQESEIDQETVNALVDYAIEHGINYFDTAPTYLRGFSEDATGIALKRYPRDSYYIATKLSNFGDSSREGSMAMYRQSFIDLQTDYIDYYLLHSIGRSMEDFQKRYIDNGMLDFLIEERKAGRIRHLGWSFHGIQEVFDYVLSMHDRIHWDFVQIQLNDLDWGHATPGNVNAEYLYGELTKRGIPAIIMEPLLGGRLSTVRAQRHDLHGASAGQHPHLLPSQTAYRRGPGLSGGNGKTDARISYHSLQRLQVLYAMPLWHRHTRHPAALQQMRQ